MATVINKQFKSTNNAIAKVGASQLLATVESSLNQRVPGLFAAGVGNFEAFGTFGGSTNPYGQFAINVTNAITNLLSVGPQDISDGDLVQLRRLAAFNVPGCDVIRDKTTSATPGPVNALLHGNIYGIPYVVSESALLQNVNNLIHILMRPFANNGANYMMAGTMTIKKCGIIVTGIRSLMISYAKMNIAEQNAKLAAAAVIQAIGYKACEILDYIAAVNTETDVTAGEEIFHPGSTTAYVRKLTKGRYDILVVHYHQAHVDAAGQPFNLVGPPPGNLPLSFHMCRCITRYMVDGTTVTLTADKHIVHSAAPSLFPAFPEYVAEDGIVTAVIREVAMSSVLFGNAETLTYNVSGALTEELLVEGLQLFQLCMKPRFMSDLDYFMFFITYGKEMITCVPTTLASLYITSSVLNSNPKGIFSEVRAFFSDLFGGIADAIDWLAERVATILGIGAEVAPLVLVAIA